MRDHKPVVIDSFKGLYQRGSVEEVPVDHFSDCENIRFIGTSAVGTRWGLDRHQTVAAPLGRIRRIYNYITQDRNTLLVLTQDGSDPGRIYHVIDPGTVYGPILQVTGMTDFGFVPYAGRAYITPFSSFMSGGLNIEKGLQNQFLYVYKGDGTPARKAAGNPPTGQIQISHGGPGFTDPGIHLFGVVFETDTGYLTAPRAFNKFSTNATTSVSFTNIPISPDSFVVKRHIVATPVIQNFNGDFEGYQYFFIPNATLNDNISTSLPNISFFDQDLLRDASHLNDNFSEIPAGAGLTLYRNRLVLHTTYNDISLLLVSAPGEPEAISQIDGLLTFPLDGNPITAAAELRDTLYVFKRNRTGAFHDNGDDPSTWSFVMIDQALGCPVHGIATVIDSGSASVDYLLVATYTGIHLFNGLYSSPELSWKIRDFWGQQNRNEFRRIQLVNDPVNQSIYCALPDGRLLVGDYANGMTARDIRWVPWRFDVRVDTVALVNINDLIIGARERLAWP
ncbi:MAG: hypothetical protein QXE45_04435 [Thermoplasmata archaeon]